MGEEQGPCSRAHCTALRDADERYDTHAGDGRERWWVAMDSSELVPCVLTQPTGKGYHPFQILFARMSITVICSSLYMWHKKTEHFPWGLREVRPWVVARGLTGFFGVFGMYCKLFLLAVWYNNVLQALTASSPFQRGTTALIAVMS